MMRVIALLSLLLMPAVALAQAPVDATDPNAPKAQEPAPTPPAPEPTPLPNAQDPAPPPNAPAPPPSAPAPTAQPEPPPAWMASLKEADRARIQNLSESRDKALALAAGGKPDDLRVTRDLLAAAPLPLDPARLTGIWRCRSFQLGGIFPLTINPFFACRIRRDGNALWLEKTTGSILRRARLDPIDDTRLLMFGAYYAGGDKPRPYGADDYYDEVGILERIAPNRLRVELPEPRAYNSARHEVIELVK